MKRQISRDSGLWFLVGLVCFMVIMFSSFCPPTICTILTVWFGTVGFVAFFMSIVVLLY